MSRSGSDARVDEQDGLNAIVSRGPGVERVKDIRPHLKGGFAVSLDVQSDSVDRLAEYISIDGYMLVL